jgi:hypothetical protein
MMTKAQPNNSREDEDQIIWSYDISQHTTNQFAVTPL